jgi:aminopeptidase-like protein
MKTMTPIDWTQLTVEADDLLQRLFPICRSITGDGLRLTLNLLREISDFQLHEVPSGTPCYDWRVPDEWNVRDAYVSDSKGQRVIDFKNNNIHLVNYSVPFEGQVSYDELAPHLHSLPDLPTAIPYRTTYYNRTWGFCLSHEQFLRMDKKEKYHVVVDTSLVPGALTYGEKILPGLSGMEFLLSTYVCHPSMANDNLSGVVLWTLLLREMSTRSLHHSYRFVIAPETIGALAYIASHEQVIKEMKGGLVVTTVAGPGQFGYKNSFRGDSIVDRAVRLTFRELALEYTEFPFDVNGSDERQYSSPGLRVPIGTICKDKYYEYPSYHTSLDNLDFVSAANLVETLKVTMLVIEKLEQNRVYRSLNPIGEPMLGKRGLYPGLGGAVKQIVADANVHEKRGYTVDATNIIPGNELDAIRWAMFFADGQTSLLEMAERTGLPMVQLYEVTGKLVASGLLKEVVE